VKEISISTVLLQKKYGDMRALEIAKEAGFDAVDFNLEVYGGGENCIYHRSWDEFETYFTNLKKKADELGIKIGQTHGRGLTFTPDEERNDFIRFVTERDIKATKLLGAPACVIHSVSPLKYGKVSGDMMRDLNQKMFGEFIPWAEEAQVKIAQETFGNVTVDGEKILDFFGNVHELKAQHEQLPTEWKTLCMDTGHVNLATAFGVMPPEDAIRFFGDAITLTHLHDNNTFTDQHLPPRMEGTINWENVFDAFEEIGYKGTYNFELHMYYFGDLMEEYVRFLGKYLRKFVDEHGKIY